MRRLGNVQLWKAMRGDWHTAADLARATGFCKVHVMARCRQLVDAGFAIREFRSGKKGGQGLSHMKAIGKQPPDGFSVDSAYVVRRRELLAATMLFCRANTESINHGGL